MSTSGNAKDLFFLLVNINLKLFGCDILSYWGPYNEIFYDGYCYLLSIMDDFNQFI